MKSCGVSSLILSVPIFYSFSNGMGFSERIYRSTKDSKVQSTHEKLFSRENVLILSSIQEIFTLTQSWTFYSSEIFRKIWKTWTSLGAGEERVLCFNPFNKRNVKLNINVLNWKQRLLSSGWILNWKLSFSTRKKNWASGYGSSLFSFYISLRSLKKLDLFVQLKLFQQKLDGSQRLPNTKSR